MEEQARRTAAGGPQFQQLRPGQQFQIDLKNAVPKVCKNMIVDHTGLGPRERVCGCKYFQPVVMLFTVSALVSPTGQELTAQQPVLICMECKTPVK